MAEAGDTEPGVRAAYCTDRLTKAVSLRRVRREYKTALGSLGTPRCPGRIDRHWGLQTTHAWAAAAAGPVGSTRTPTQCCTQLGHRLGYSICSSPCALYRQSHLWPWSTGDYLSTQLSLALISGLPRSQNTP